MHLLRICCKVNVVVQELVAKAGGQPVVSSLQDLYDAMYPYRATPWALQDIGHKGPSAWRAVAALAVRAPHHLPAAIRSQVSYHATYVPNGTPCLFLAGQLAVSS